jgi:hypothetical protein
MRIAPTELLSFLSQEARMRQNASSSLFTRSDRRSAVSRVRDAAKTAILETRRSRRTVAQETRQALRSHRAKIRAAVRGLCEALRGASGSELMTPLANVHPCAPDAVERFPGGVFDLVVDSDGSNGNITATDLLDVVETHPEGISLVDIGNELGVDWRDLLGLSDRLLSDGEVEKIQELFYPARY